MLCFSPIVGPVPMFCITHDRSIDTVQVASDLIIPTSKKKIVADGGSEAYMPCHGGY